MKMVCRLVLAMVVLGALPARGAGPCFVITVSDAQSGRGVPLVELKTTDNVRRYTDSNGIVAIDEPALLNHKVFFALRSHGYEYPADGFGFRGQALEVKPGGSATIKIKRVNIAERLYRLTGAGIYDQSVRAGRPVPLRQGLLNGGVVGQDSACVAVWGGKIRWFWGDTNRLAYPLGHFGTAGATSELPGQGGLDPAVGVDLTYFVDAAGFSRPMLARDGSHPRWVDAVLVVKDEHGAEQLLAACATMKSLGECLGRSLVIYNESQQAFAPLQDIPLTAPLFPRGQVLRAGGGGSGGGGGGGDYLYFTNPWPNVRVKADWDSVRTLARYEAFTCVAPGQRYPDQRGARVALERDAQGKLVWGWKADTAPVDFGQAQALVAAGAITPAEVWFAPRDVESKKPVRLHAGSVSYNAYKRKYVMIAEETGGGPSFMGEIYYGESLRPEGPWPWVRKIVTHDRYSFYNPVHHPFFDQDGGRLIYFEGTYAITFSGNNDATPLYDYNQIMYRLDLSDPRLEMP